MGGNFFQCNRVCRMHSLKTDQTQLDEARWGLSELRDSLGGLADFLLDSSVCADGSRSDRVFSALLRLVSPQDHKLPVSLVVLLYLLNFFLALTRSTCTPIAFALASPWEAALWRLVKLSGSCENCWWSFLTRKELYFLVSPQRTQPGTFILIRVSKSSYFFLFKINNNHYHNSFLCTHINS